MDSVSSWATLARRFSKAGNSSRRFAKRANTSCLCVGETERYLQYPGYLHDPSGGSTVNMYILGTGVYEDHPVCLLLLRDSTRPYWFLAASR